MMIDGPGLDQRVRLAAFDFLQEKVRIHDDLLPHATLQQGFIYEGRRVPLLGPQGIFKPAILAEIPLSILTTPPREKGERPYPDSFLPEEGLLRYSYRGDDPFHRDNRGLREAMSRKVPVIYFHGIARGSYLAFWPVYVVGDDPNRRFFIVDLTGAVTIREPHVVHGGDTDESDVQRAYRKRTVLQRLHQADFRERVLRAYRTTCSVCRLRHREFLDAAHILEDRHPEGKPVVSNGIALCKLHHAAFDQNFLGIRPDCIVVIRGDILKESDGPMLLHGLQGLHGAKIQVPVSAAHRPNADFLAERYERFQQAG